MRFQESSQSSDDAVEDVGVIGDDKVTSDELDERRLPRSTEVTSMSPSLEEQLRERFKPAAAAL
jgi:hypothetical protein